MSSPLRFYWLLKTEPEVYSFEMLLKEQSTLWTGVRNFQARNYLKQCSIGDLALIYHTGKQKAVYGVAQVTHEGIPEWDSKKPGEWVQIKIAPLRLLPRPVTLGSIKADPQLKDLALLRQSRLSVMPLTALQFEKILSLAQAS